MSELTCTSLGSSLYYHLECAIDYHRLSSFEFVSTSIYLFTESPFSAVPTHV